MDDFYARIITDYVALYGDYISSSKDYIDTTFEVIEPKQEEPKQLAYEQKEQNND